MSQRDCTRERTGYSILVCDVCMTLSTLQFVVKMVEMTSAACNVLGHAASK